MPLILQVISTHWHGTKLNPYSYCFPKLKLRTTELIFCLCYCWYFCSDLMLNTFRQTKYYENLISKLRSLNFTNPFILSVQNHIIMSISLVTFVTFLSCSSGNLGYSYVYLKLVIPTNIHLLMMNLIRCQQRISSPIQHLLALINLTHIKNLINSSFNYHRNQKTINVRAITEQQPRTCVKSYVAFPCFLLNLLSNSNYVNFDNPNSGILLYLEPNQKTFKNLTFCFLC